ncbi:MAG: hypothetical protein LBH10_04975 [Burkholderiaceae bacterium]|jgi:hypothetical protein|nr:hypothetical protein [Burkholderiaceae bacterium]
MPKPFVNKWLCALAAGAALLCADMASAASAPGLTFESVFNTRGEPAALYYRATFAGAGGAHTLQVWRDGQTRLRRKTDQAIDTYVVRGANNLPDYQMTVVDYRKRITTRINRDNLIQLGHFSDWFDLAHGLRHPAGAYRLVAAAAPAGAPAPVAPCRWYALTQDGGDTHRICWSARERLPLEIWSDQTAAAVWRVTQVDHRPVGAAVFQLHDAGFVRDNANADIDRD